MCKPHCLFLHNRSQQIVLNLTGMCYDLCITTGGIYPLLKMKRRYYFAAHPLMRGTKLNLPVYYFTHKHTHMGHTPRMKFYNIYITPGNSD